MREWLVWLTGELVGLAFWILVISFALGIIFGLTLLLEVKS